MRGGARVVAALVLAAVGLIALGRPTIAQAKAEDESAATEAHHPSPGPSLVPPIDASLDPTMLLFGGADGWGHGAFVHTGLLWSPAGLDRSGFTLKVLMGGGVYRFHSGALNTDIAAVQSTGFILPGWRFVQGPLQVTFFAGLDVQAHKLWPDDVASRLRGLIWGVRGGFDLWYQPTAKSMISADASASTVGDSYSARLAFGWRVLDMLYVGPEIGASGSDNYRQFRAGFHATGLRLGPFEWVASAGWASDSDQRGSPYGRLSLMVRR
jgi:hypothetical protein